MAGLRRYFIESGADTSLAYSIADGQPAPDNGYADQIVLEDIISVGFSDFTSIENNNYFYYLFIKYHDNYYKIKIFDYYDGSELYSIEPIWYSSNLTIQEKIKKYFLELLAPSQIIQISDKTYKQQPADIPPMIDMSTKLQQIYYKSSSNSSKIYFSYYNQQFYINTSQSSYIIENIVFIPSGEGMTDLEKLQYYFCTLQILPENPSDAFPAVNPIPDADSELIMKGEPIENNDEFEIYFQYHDSIYSVSFDSNWIAISVEDITDDYIEVS